MNRPSKHWIPYVLAVSVLSALASVAMGQTTGPMGSLCRQTEGDLYQLFAPDMSDVMSAVRSGIASEVRTYRETLTPDEAQAFRTRMRRLTLGDIEGLPAPLAAAAKRALAPALSEVFSQASLSEYQRRLDGIDDRLGRMSIPGEPALPVVPESLTTCAELRLAVAALRDYENAWRLWSSDLANLAALPPLNTQLCDALSPRRYAEIAQTLGQLEVPLTEIGLLIDTVTRGGTAQAAELFNAVHDLSQTALAIELRLKNLGRRAKAAHDNALPRFRNLEANVEEVVGPAMLSACEIERRENNETPPASPNTPTPPAAPPAPPRRPPTQLVQWVMTERGYLRRDGTSQTWRETFDNDSRVFTFEQQQLNNGVLVMFDSSRGYTFKVPLVRNSCVELSLNGTITDACYYRVQDVNYTLVP